MPRKPGRKKAVDGRRMKATETTPFAWFLTLAFSFLDAFLCTLLKWGQKAFSGATKQRGNFCAGCPKNKTIKHLQWKGSFSLANGLERNISGTATTAKKTEELMREVGCVLKNWDQNHHNLDIVHYLRITCCL